MTQQSRFYAIIPAAGQSKRMGRSKLLLPWPTENGTNVTILEHVLQTWVSSRVHRIVVVIRSDADIAVHEICRSYDIDVVNANDPADMKASCLIGLHHVSSRYAPVSRDRFFICPADIPRISTELIDRLVDQAKRFDATPDASRVVLPAFAHRRGHPVLFPWPMSSEFAMLSNDEGINVIVNRSGCVEVEFSDISQALDDIDTPDDYAAAIKEFKK